MSKTMSWPRLCAVLLAAALASCGGGGGSSAPPLQVTASASSMALSGIAPSAAPDQMVTFTLTGGQGPYYIGAKTSGGTVMPNLYILDDNRIQYVLQAVADPNQPQREQGTYTLAICSDDQCAHVVWQHDYPYTYTQFQLDLAPLSLTGTEGMSGTPVTLPVTPADTGHLLSAMSAPAWLSLAHDDAGNLVLTPSGAGLAAGSYADRLLLQANQDGQTQVSIPVSLTLGSGIVAPALADLVQQRDTTTAMLAGTAPVSFVGGTDRAWTASSDTAWLVVDSPSGTGAGTLRYHVDAAKAQRAVSNFGAAMGSITLHANGLSDAVSTLHLARQLPEIAMLVPGQVEPGQATTLTVTGRGLSQVTSADQVQVGGQPAAGVTILSDTRAVVQVAAQAAGSLQVGVANAALVRTAQADLAVSSAPPKYATVPAPANDSKDAIVYDPSRHAVFAASYYGNTLQRFKLASGSTWNLTAVPWAGIWRVQMSPDRRTLYVLAADGLYEVDPDTLATRTKHAAPTGQSFFSGFYFDQPMPLTSDLRLWVPGTWAQYFDIRTGTWLQAADEFGGAAAEDLTATPDGEHLYTLEGSFTPAPPDGWWSAQSHTTTPLPAGVLNFYYRASFDLQGTVGIFEGSQVYRTSDWSLVGTIQMPTANETARPDALLSPDGTRAYVLGGTDYYGNADRIEVFDLTQLQPGTSALVHLGTIPVANPAVSCSWQYECDGSGRLAIDPLGKTIFWSGNAAFTVIPIPSSLTGASTVQAKAAVQGAPRSTRLHLATPAPARARATAH